MRKVYPKRPGKRLIEPRTIFTKTKDNYAVSFQTRASLIIQTFRSREPAWHYFEDMGSQPTFRSVRFLTRMNKGALK